MKKKKKNNLLFNTLKKRLKMKIDHQLINQILPSQNNLFNSRSLRKRLKKILKLIKKFQFQNMKIQLKIVRIHKIMKIKLSPLTRKMTLKGIRFRTLRSQHQWKISQSCLMLKMSNNLASSQLLPDHMDQSLSLPEPRSSLSTNQQNLSTSSCSRTQSMHSSLT